MARCSCLRAYMGWQFYTNPSFLFGIAPLIAAFIAGLSLLSILQPLVVRWQISGELQKQGPRLLTVAAVVLGFIALRGGRFSWPGGYSDGLHLRDCHRSSGGSLRTGGPGRFLDPTRAADGCRRFDGAGLLRDLVIKTRSVDKSAAKRGWIGFGLLLILTLILTLVRESGPVAVLKMNGDVRFVLALIVGTMSGFGIGVAVERVLVRDLVCAAFLHHSDDLGSLICDS